MSQSASRPKPRRSAIGTEEEKAWVSFYRRAGKDPAIAAEVLAQLDADPEMKREHLALYLCCRESLRVQQARDARNQRIGQFVRWLMDALLVRLPSAAARSLGHGSDVAVACLPENASEPAQAQVRRLSKDPKVRSARTAFKAPTTKLPTPAESSTDPAQALPQRGQATG
ncbi:hypothetical protein ALISP_7280 [Alicycliphilus sp. B1]|nr:hypothetical protein ALISP_7280 [Alicycliphilus sp. B1]